MKPPLKLNIQIDFNGPEGNVFLILSKCRSTLQKLGYNETIFQEFKSEACKSTYSHFLLTLNNWFNVESITTDNSFRSK